MSNDTSSTMALDVGHGTPVLCLHSSLGVHAQWRSLAERLQHSFRVMAPDLLGYGANNAWQPERRLRLDDEVERIAAHLATLDQPAHVVAHSFGGAVAFKLAATHPELVASLSVYEPALFCLLLANQPSSPATSEILDVARSSAALTRVGARAGACRLFLDYWCGHGAWDATPRERQALYCERIAKVGAEFSAILRETLGYRELSRLQVPVQLICGGRTTASARGVMDLLRASLPYARTDYVADAGHMGPVSHAEEVNAIIEDHLLACTPSVARLAA